jgi:hypothetical protein
MVLVGDTPRGADRHVLGTLYGATMALTEIEEARVRKIVGGFVERRRPPLRIRQELDLAYRISGQSVEIFEIRQRWYEPSEKFERPVAKANFVRKHAIWKVIGNAPT